MTREQVNAAIRKHLQAKNLAVAIVTDDGHAAPRAAPLGQADAAGLRHRGHAGGDPGRGQGDRIVAAGDQRRAAADRAGEGVVRAVSGRRFPAEMRPLWNIPEPRFQP